MDKVGRRGIVVGASSDIGLEIVSDWVDRGISIVGTYRTESKKLLNIAPRMAALLHCDFAQRETIDALADELIRKNFIWNYLVICPGTMEPVGPFVDTDINAWSAAFEVNFIATMRTIHRLLPLRYSGEEEFPLVLLFAGGGTNSAPSSYSAYTISKIAMIKAIELLDAEVCDVRFTILGPGWVRTKIHEETLRANDKAPEALAETLRRLEENEFHTISRVVECVTWAMQAPRNVIGGRNFSVVHDDWSTPKLAFRLSADRNLYKLRRAGN
jgi:NAD(P)-dependent dehydrogenase (short-subunit alcohol dehydrogenase family)